MQRKVWYINILGHKRLGHYRRTPITYIPVIRITLRKRYWCWKLIEQTNEYCMIYNTVMFCSFLQQFEVVNLWTFRGPSNRKCSVAVTGIKRVQSPPAERNVRSKQWSRASRCYYTTSPVTLDGLGENWWQLNYFRWVNKELKFFLILSFGPNTNRFCRN